MGYILKARLMGVKKTLRHEALPMWFYYL